MSASASPELRRVLISQGMRMQFIVSERGFSNHPVMYFVSLIYKPFYYSLQKNPSTLESTWNLKLSSAHPNWMESCCQCQSPTVILRCPWNCLWAKWWWVVTWEMEIPFTWNRIFRLSSRCVTISGTQYRDYSIPRRSPSAWTNNSRLDNCWRGEEMERGRWRPNRRCTSEDCQVGGGGGKWKSCRRFIYDFSSSFQNLLPVDPCWVARTLRDVFGTWRSGTRFTIGRTWMGCTMSCLVNVWPLNSVHSLLCWVEWERERERWWGESH